MASTQNQPLPPRPKRKSARDQMLEDMVEYHKKPNARLLHQLKEKGARANNQFDPLFRTEKGGRRRHCCYVSPFSRTFIWDGNKRIRFDFFSKESE